MRVMYPVCLLPPTGRWINANTQRRLTLDPLQYLISRPPLVLGVLWWRCKTSSTVEIQFNISQKHDSAKHAHSHKHKTRMVDYIMDSLSTQATQANTRYFCTLPHPPHWCKFCAPMTIHMMIQNWEDTFCYLSICNGGQSIWKCSLAN